jgi:hypothetical protein
VSEQSSQVGSIKTRKKEATHMGTEEGERYVMGNGTGGHRLPALLIMLVAMVVATVVVIIVALDTGTARAATPTRASIEATQFTVGSNETGEAFAVCPGTKRALGGEWYRAVRPAAFSFLLAGRLTQRDSPLRPKTAI